MDRQKLLEIISGYILVNHPEPRLYRGHNMTEIGLLENEAGNTKKLSFHNYF